MQVSGRVKIKRHVLAENTTLHEVYHHVQLDLVGPVTFLLENPNFLEDKDGEFGFVCQLTPSGTLDFKFIPDPPELDAENAEKSKKAAAELQAASVKAQKAEATNNLGTLKPASADEVKEELKNIEDAEKNAEKNRGDLGSLGLQSPIKSELDSDGNVPENKDKKKSAAETLRVKKARARQAAKKK